MDDLEVDQPVPPKKPRLRKKVLLIPAAIAALAVVIAKTVLMPVEVSGDSMYPTYRNGTIHFIYKLAYRDRAPQRGDIVGIRATDGDLYIKRIVGLPHEVIAIRNGRIYVDGRRLKESFGRGAIPGRLDPTKLDADDYFVVGDNRSTSVLGTIARDNIVGKVVR